jgi:excisionase family DNA binding protein
MSKEQTKSAMLNSHEACAVLGVSYSTLWKLTKSKAIPSYKPNTGRNSRVYFDKNELLQYLKAGRR